MVFGHVLVPVDYGVHVIVLCKFFNIASQFTFALCDELMKNFMRAPCDDDFSERDILCFPCKLLPKGYFICDTRTKVCGLQVQTRELLHGSLDVFLFFARCGTATDSVIHARFEKLFTLILVGSIKLNGDMREINDIRLVLLLKKPGNGSELAGSIADELTGCIFCRCNFAKHSRPSLLCERSPLY